MRAEVGTKDADRDSGCFWLSAPPSVITTLESQMQHVFVLQEPMLAGDDPAKNLKLT
jgi:hypothetical protein